MGRAARVVDVVVAENPAVDLVEPGGVLLVAAAVLEEGQGYLILESRVS
jgi:hypothetical protein